MASVGLFFSLKFYLSSSCCSILLNHYQHKTETHPVERWYSWQQSFFTVNCTDTSCFLFSEASLPILEAWSWSGSVTNVITLSHFHNHTNIKHTHAAYVKTNIQRRWHKPHKCRYSYLPYQLPDTFLSLFLWWKGDWDIPSITPHPLPKGDVGGRGDTADATAIVSYLFILSLKL